MQVLQTKLGKHAECLDLICPNKHGRDGRSVPSRQLLADPLPRANECHGINELVRHSFRCLRFPAREVQILHPGRPIFIAEVTHLAVVEVLTTRAHATDIQGQAGLHRRPALVEVIAHYARDIRRKIETLHAFAATSLRESGLKM